jgi:hypothetical protein
VTNTANQRVKNQRQARTRAGWVEVRVWVPTKEDAAAVRDFAAKLRSKILNRQQLEHHPGAHSMSEETRNRVIEAMESQGSKKHTTPSGPFLDLLTDLSKGGQLAEMSMSFEIFRKAFPGNARFVANSVGAKMANYFFIPSLGLNGTSKFLHWAESHQDWARALADSLLDGQFQHTAENMLADIK